MLDRASKTCKLPGRKNQAQLTVKLYKGNEFGHCKISPPLAKNHHFPNNLL